MKGPIVITGAGGFLGRSLAEVLGRKFLIRPTDLLPGESLDAEFCGNVSDPDFAMRLLDGAEALVLSHMYPRGPGAYDHPSRPFDVNVTAVANLLDAAVRQGCRRVVIISSIAVVYGHLPSGARLDHATVPAPVDLYGLTKSIQETLAEYYHRCHGLSIAMLRPAYVTDESTMTDKYGRVKATVNWQYIDRRDIAAATAAALLLPDLGLETFFITGHSDGHKRLDLSPAIQRLGWNPEHTFSAYPNDPS